MSCKITRSTLQYSTFHFVNETNSDIHIQGWYLRQSQQDFRISKNSSIDIEKEQANASMNPDEFFHSDSLEITFENNKKLIYSWYRKSPTKNYLGNGLGYKEERTSENHIKFTYFITQEHIDSAK